MPIYEIGWYHHDEAIHAILEHPQKFLKTELRSMFRAALRKSVAKLLEDPEYKQCWIGLQDAFYSCLAETHVADIMCEEFGFKEVKPVSVGEFGHGILDEGCEWFPDDLNQKVIEHNKQVQAWIDSPEREALLDAELARLEKECDDAEAEDGQGEKEKA